MLLLGGDDYSYELHKSALPLSLSDRETTGGGLLNDVWIMDPSDLQRTYYFATHGVENGNAGYLRGSSPPASADFALQIHWNETDSGRNPPATTSYEDWIVNSDSIGAGETMWSPRRGHEAAVTHDDSIYVIGGRAREQIRVEDHHLVGGLRDHRIETLHDHSSQREEIMLQDDVWRSTDGLGVDWELVTPGCGDHHQEDILLNTELWSELGASSGAEGRHNVGTAEAAKCSTSSDCYGVAECRALAGGAPTTGSTDGKVCVCPMFSAREHHSVSVQQRAFTDRKGNVHVQDYIFVVGGFARVRQVFCGNHACNDDGYRVALDDAWVSTDGSNWLQIRPAFSMRTRRADNGQKGSEFQGRGGHSSVVIHSNPFRMSGSVSVQQAAGTKDRLVILGGESSNPTETNTAYLNDIWSVELSPEPCCKKKAACVLTPAMIHSEGCLPTTEQWVRQRNADWSGRSGHATIYEPPSAHNAFGERMLVVGGINTDDGVLSDVWTWNNISFTSASDGDDGLSTSSSAHIEPWERDFAGPSQDHGPYQNYLSVHSEVSALVSYLLPDLTDDSSDEDDKQTDIPTSDLRHLSALPLVSPQDVDRMKSVGISTIQDLSEASVYDILKLRGIDNPWLEQVPAVHNICYLKTLADAFIDKCSGGDDSGSNGSDSMAKATTTSRAKEVVYTDKSLRNSTYCAVTLPTAPDECYPYEWNGCTPIDEFDLVDVYGLGNVDLPLVEHDPSLDLGELHCRNTPPARYMSSSVFVDNKAIIIGGRDQSLDTLYSDVWARDDTFPLAVITKKPRSFTAESRFDFSSTKSTAQMFEYKVLDTEAKIELVPWQMTTTDEGADVSWLDWRNGGPGRGWYTLVVRAVDLSGNRDATYGDTNVHKWLYIPRPPVGKILAGVLCSILLLCGVRFEYHRREQKKALERYALRRARRKYRLKQNGGEWERLMNYEDKHFRTNRSAPSSRRGRSAGRASRSRSSRDIEGGEVSGEEIHYGSSSYDRSRSRKRRRRRSVDDRHGSRSRSKSEYHRGKISERERERRRRKQHRRTRRTTEAPKSGSSSRGSSARKKRL